MAYIININPTGAVTIELSQGRVQLDPLKYCELYPKDIERALKIYNNAEMGLYVAETDKELNLILDGHKSKVKSNENTEPIVNPDTDTNNDQDPDSETEKSDEEDSTTTEETVTENPTDADEDSTDTEEETEEDKEEAIKKQIIDSVEKYRAANNLNALKELAAKLKIPFMHNISSNTLANKIIDSIK